MIIAVIALVVLAGYLIGVKIVNETVGLVNELPKMWDALEEDLHRKIFPFRHKKISG